MEVLVLGMVFEQTKRKYQLKLLAEEKGCIAPSVDSSSHRISKTRNSYEAESGCCASALAFEASRFYYGIGSLYQIKKIKTL